MMTHFQPATSLMLLQMIAAFGCFDAHPLLLLLLLLLASSSLHPRLFVITHFKFYGALRYT